MEKHLIRIIDNLREGIIVHDLYGKIFLFNKAAERITGYRREEVLFKGCHDGLGLPLFGEGRLLAGQNDALQQDMPGSGAFPVTFFSKEGKPLNVEVSVSAMKDEAGDMIGFLALLKDKTDHLQFQTPPGGIRGFGEMVGRNRKMLGIYRQIEELMAYDYPVHIYGESGTGKELVAETIHNKSRRAGLPFVPINCGALPEGLIESELFGHVKGAFSGAIRDKKGRLELADGGTIFLDEVADLPWKMQVELLRFLETSTFIKVGGEETVFSDVRIISATNQNLKKALRQNRFREDLYYRLNVIPIHLPPLRERKDDIPLLIKHFLQQFAEESRTPQIGLSRSAMAIMADYKWPGNVRQLQNVLHYAIVKCTDSIIRPCDLPMELKLRR